MTWDGRGRESTLAYDNASGELFTRYACEACGLKACRVNERYCVRCEGGCEFCDEPEGRVKRRSDGTVLCDACDFENDPSRDRALVEAATDEREFYGGMRGGVR